MWWRGKSCLFQTSNQQNLNEQKTGQELNAVLALRKQKSVGDQLGEQQHAF